VSNRYNYQTLTIQSVLEVVGVRIKELNLTLLAIYRPPSLKVTANDWCDLAKQVHGSALIGGDFNLHHVLWGCGGSSPEGTLFVDQVLSEIEYVVLNTGGNTRIPYVGQQPSALDLTLASTNVALKCSWNVLACKATNLAVIALTSKYWNAKQLPPLVKVYMHDPPAHHGDCKFPTAHPFHKKYDDLTTPLSVFVPKYTDCPTHNTSVLLEMFDSLPSDTIRIYTDGSKMKEGTGCAFCYRIRTEGTNQG
jgi:hypothetical protein